LSNLLKQYYINNAGQGARVINSDDRLQARLQKENEALKQTVSKEQEETAEEFKEGIELKEEIETVDVEAIRQEAIEAARAEAEKITAEAQEKAKQFMKDAEQQAQAMLAENKQLGYEQGLADAKDEFQQKTDALEEDMRAQKKELFDNYEKKLTGMESDIVDAIIHVFDKVFNIQFEDKREILMALVNNTLMDVEAGDRIRIHANDEDFPTFEKHMPEIQDKVGANVEVEMVRDNNLSEGQCQIETPFGVFDCGVDTELSGLLKDIRSLA
jgi:flagellar assembly protein FliH